MHAAASKMDLPSDGPASSAVSQQKQTLPMIEDISVYQHPREPETRKVHHVQTLPSVLPQPHSSYTSDETQSYQHAPETNLKMIPPDQVPLPRLQQQLPLPSSQGTSRYQHADELNPNTTPLGQPPPALSQHALSTIVDKLRCQQHESKPDPNVTPLNDTPTWTPQRQQQQRPLTAPHTPTTHRHSRSPLRPQFSPVTPSRRREDSGHHRKRSSHGTGHRSAGPRRIDEYRPNYDREAPTYHPPSRSLEERIQYPRGQAWREARKGPDVRGW